VNCTLPGSSTNAIYKLKFETGLAKGSIEKEYITERRCMREERFPAGIRTHSIN
jgi:hypothetical protein